PYSVVGGTPAKLVKYRFDESIIAELLKMRIYDWPLEKFEVLKRYLCASDIQQLKSAVLAYDGQK
ncbi:antibiotic acetyltransferase, partial [Vibrio clamense]